MKLYIKLVGTFNRIPIDSGSLESEAVTLQEWMRSHFAVATQVRQRQPSLLRQRFGLDFLSESSINKLLEASHKEGKINSDLIPPWLQPAITVEAQPTLYRYEFVSPEAKIELQPDDPQLPNWETDDLSGIYEIVVTQKSHRDLSQVWLDRWLMAKQEWDNYSSCDRLKLAWQSPDSPGLNFYLSDLPRIKVSIPKTDLAPEIQAAIAFLRQETDLANLSEAAIALVKEYQTEFGGAIELPLPQKIESLRDIGSQFIIGKRINRKAIEELIERASEFLLISSYVIEDRGITELIC